MEKNTVYRRDLRQTIRFLFVITLLMIIVVGIMDIFQSLIPDEIDTNDVRKYIFYLWGVTFIYSAIMLGLDYYDVDAYKPKEKSVEPISNDGKKMDQSLE